MKETQEMKKVKDNQLMIFLVLSEGLSNELIIGSSINNKGNANI
jgi:hypothetical protein